MARGSTNTKKCLLTLKISHINSGDFILISEKLKNYN